MLRCSNFRKFVEMCFHFDVTISSLNNASVFLYCLGSLYTLMVETFSVTQTNTETLRG